jgi:glucose/arabinose dehydrogenase
MAKAVAAAGPAVALGWVGVVAAAAAIGQLACGRDEPGGAPAGTGDDVGARTEAVVATALFRWRGSNDGVNDSYGFHFTQPFTWRRVYIDTDHAAATGFQTSGIGAEFLIENTLLYRHSGAGWSWTSIGSSGLVESGDGVTFTIPRALIGQTAFPATNNLAFEGENTGSPIQTTPSYQHVYTPDGPIAGYFAENDGTNVYYQASFAANNAFKHVFIDADLDPTTGFAFAGIGADFLIENDFIFRHADPGWSWTRLASTPATGGATGVKSWTVPRALIGETAATGERSNLVFHGSGGSAAEFNTPVYQHVFTPAPGAPACGSTPPPLRLTPFITGLTEPLSVMQAPGDSTRWFVVEQRGLVRIWNGVSIAATPFLDVTALDITSTNEQGLLGLAFHPGYASNGLFYVNYTRPGTAPGGQSLIAELRRTTADTASSAIVRTLVTLDQPTGFHNAGQLAFGPTDGLLYASLGDGDTGGAPAQNDATRAGKILRIDVAPATPAVSNLDKGLRNPWRFSFDPPTGNLYIADVGENTTEEIDVHPAGAGSLNFGWPIMEGPACFGASTCNMTGLTLPVDSYQHPPANCAVTGGFVYRGARIPCLGGWYIYADYCSRRVWAFTYSGGIIHDKTELTADLNAPALIPAAGITSFGVDNAGELYVVSRAGTIYRIDPE